MKEMIERLIADGWKWVSCDKDLSIYVYDKKPYKKSLVFTKNSPYDKASLVPSCLFPDITFETSPVELKTLLVDDIEELKEQETIKDYISSNLDFLIRVDDNLNNNQDGVVFLANDKGDDYLPIADNNVLAKYAPKKYEKVYLKDLVKKRKVKKSVWLAVDKNNNCFLYPEKPFRHMNKWITNLSSSYTTSIKDLDFLQGLEIEWEDEPIELTYEVEE